MRSNYEIVCKDKYIYSLIAIIMQLSFQKH